MTYYYRALKAGDVATESALDDREMLSAPKGSNQTINNSVTNQADSALTLSVSANATYHLSVGFVVSGPAAADWKIQWTFPAGATGQVFGHGPATTVTTVRTTQIHGRSAPIATALGYGTDGSENSLIRQEILLFTAGTAGSFAATWSQLVATVGTTTVRAGSWMTAERVV